MLASWWWATLRPRDDGWTGSPPRTRQHSRRVAVSCADGCVGRPVPSRGCFSSHMRTGCALASRTSAASAFVGALTHQRPPREHMANRAGHSAIGRGYGAPGARMSLESRRPGRRCAGRASVAPLAPGSRRPGRAIDPLPLIAIRGLCYPPPATAPGPPRARDSGAGTALKQVRRGQP